MFPRLDKWFNEMALIRAWYLISEGKMHGSETKFNVPKSQYCLFYMAGPVLFGDAVMQSDGTGIQNVGMDSGERFFIFSFSAVAVFLLVQTTCQKIRMPVFSPSCRDNFYGAFSVVELCLFHHYGV